LLKSKRKGISWNVEVAAPQFSHHESDATFTVRRKMAGLVFTMLLLLTGTNENLSLIEKDTAVLENGTQAGP
jgi:hypothetical protein